MKTSNTNFYGLLFILILTGILFTSYQHKKLGLSFFPNQKNQIWKIDAKVKVAPIKHHKPLRINLLIPNLDKSSILEEKLIAKGFGKAITQKNNNKIAVLSLSDPKKEQTILYSLLVDQGIQISSLHIPSYKEQQDKINNSLTPEQQNQLTLLLKKIQSKSADEETLITQIIHFVNDSDHQALIEPLLSDTNNSLDGLTLNLLRQANIPSVLLHAIPYHNDLNINLTETPTWIASYYDDQWQVFDANLATNINNTNAYLIWWSGEEPLFTASNGIAKQTILSTQAQSISQSQFLNLKYSNVANTLYSYSLSSLPAQTQQTYKIIVMVPLGVLIILILRILIGIPTIGTFMPVLISLAFRDTTLLWGIILFCIIVLIGLSFRSYFESLKILVVPRLGMMLCIVIITMCIISILANKLSVQQGLSITLFPMVILTMTIERISILWEERGPKEALTNAFGSLFCASIIYLFIFNPTLEYIFLNFPGLILIVMAFMLVLGKYHGYRLTELFRFKALATPGG